MRYLKIRRDNLSKLFDSLKRFGEVYAPVKKSNSYSFTAVDSLDDVSLNYNRTILPPKKFFIKPFEEIFKVEIGKGYYLKIEEPKTIVLLGLHACDINALKVLDSVYLDEPYDPHYFTRRSSTVIVGLSCKPDEYCFCKSMGSDYAWSGFDLFLHQIDEGYVVRVGSIRGEALISSIKDVVSEPKQEDFIKLREFEVERSKMFKKAINTSLLPDIVDSSYESDTWTKFVDKCVGCGSCNLVCPTCRCYDVFERVELNLEKGARVRRWDSCFVKSHALVAGGLNFRPARLDRFKNRFNCKSSIEPKTGLFFCVGCGRCSVFCPAGIDHADVLKALWGLGDE
ncbi:MAG: 4Fe-4S dicluster domain-containing protein [Candidatus Nezhaarchaeales archaeon]